MKIQILILALAISYSPTLRANTEEFKQWSIAVGYGLTTYNYDSSKANLSGIGAIVENHITDYLGILGFVNHAKEGVYVKYDASEVLRDKFNRKNPWDFGLGAIFTPYKASFENVNVFEMGLVLGVTTLDKIHMNQNKFYGIDSPIPGSEEDTGSSKRIKTFFGPRFTINVSSYIGILCELRLSEKFSTAFIGSHYMF